MMFGLSRLTDIDSIHWTNNYVSQTLRNAKSTQFGVYLSRGVDRLHKAS